MNEKLAIKVLIGVFMIALFIYLDHTGSDTYASQLFGALMSIVGMVFGLDFQNKRNNIEDKYKQSELEVEAFKQSR